MQHMFICAEDGHLHRGILPDVDYVLSKYFSEEFQIKLNRIEAIGGNGKNKLRTCRLFKFEPEREQCLHII